jgi:hypothetical protein
LAARNAASNVTLYVVPTVETGAPEEKLPSKTPPTPDSTLCRPVTQVHWTVSPTLMFTVAGANVRLFSATGCVVWAVAVVARSSSAPTEAPRRAARGSMGQAEGRE